MTALTPRFQRDYKIQHFNAKEFIAPYLTNETSDLPLESALKFLHAYGFISSAPDAAPPERQLLLKLGSATDIEFGPYLYLGLNGVAAEIEPSLSIMLPPLNPFLAQVMISRSPIAQALTKRGTRLNEDLAISLLQLASIITDNPEIESMELYLSENSEETFDLAAGPVRIRKSLIAAPRHLVIAPYPTEYEFHDRLKDGREIMIRPIRPEDETLHYKLFKSLSRQSNYFRFFSFRRHLTHEQAARFTQIDYDREMAIIALLQEEKQERSIGVNRLTYQARSDQHEFAIVVADEFQGTGVGSILMQRLLEIARDRQVKQIIGIVLAENLKMINFCRAFGFKVKSQEGNSITFSLDL